MTVFPGWRSARSPADRVTASGNDVPVPADPIGPGLRAGGFLPSTAAGWRAATIVCVFFALSVYFNANSTGAFLSADNINLLVRQASVLAVVAAGTAVIMVMGEIDLSIGSAIYLTGLVAAWADARWGLPLVVVALLAVGCGLALGIFQAFWIAVVGMPSFIVTLTGLLAFRGIGQTWSQAASIAPVSGTFANLTEGEIGTDIAIAGTVAIAVCGVALLVLRWRRAETTSRAIPRLAMNVIVLGAVVALSAWLTASSFGLPSAALWICGVGGVLWLVMARTPFGRASYLIGANRNAAFRAGIPVRRNIFLGFALSGVTYGLGGLLLTARLDGSTSTAGTDYELYAIAAAVLGGISLKGGAGAVPGVVGGALLLTLIQNGMDLTSTSTFTQAIVEAGILLAAVALDTLARRRT